MNPAHPARFTRREFHQLATAAALSLSAHAAIADNAPVAADNAAEAGWIDAHVHVWSPDTQRYPISPRFTRADMQPPSFTAAELLRHSQPAGVTRIVLIQMSFYEFDHRYMVEVMKAHPGTFSGVALIDYKVPAEQLTNRMDALAQQGMRGFRLHSHGDAPQWVDDPGMAVLWRRAAETGLAVCPLINPDDIASVDQLCEKFPDTTVVVDHFARIGVSGTIEPEPLKQLCRLARHPHVHVKTSAFYALGKKSPPYDDLIPMIRRVVDSFGPQRLMWASDCPFQVQGEHRYEDSIALIRDRIDFLSASDKQWMLKGTAEKVFFSV